MTINTFLQTVARRHFLPQSEVERARDLAPKLTNDERGALALGLGELDDSLRRIDQESSPILDMLESGLYTGKMKVAKTQREIEETKDRDNEQQKLHSFFPN